MWRVECIPVVSPLCSLNDKKPGARSGGPDDNGVRAISLGVRENDSDADDFYRDP